MTTAERFALPSALTETVARAVAGQFSLERELGRGGMGVVYLARDLMLDRLVALKVLPAATVSDPVSRERFLREARTSALLSHPNIVPVYQADDVDGVAYFAMAYVDGESVGDRIRDRGQVPVADAVRILREVGWALAYAHARGVVHRDVKPENILLERGTGRALVTDFGIARRLDTFGDEASSRLTRDGHVLGTLHYVSPEQAVGAELDGRSDLYALGVVGFQLLSGRLPFDDASGAGVLVAHATRPAPPLRRFAPHVPPSLAAVIDRCLAKHPDDRFPSGEAFADALEQALAVAPVASRPGGTLLPEGAPATVTEAQASAVWRRAAQLQADALHRLELRAARVPGPDGASLDTQAAPSVAFRLADVADAAREAGISAQYVAMALAELPRGEALAPGAAREAVGERQATLLLGTHERSVAVSHVVSAPPARALRALGSALRHSPYDLQLRETVGAHPLDGGVLVFDLPGPVMGASGFHAGQANKYWFATRHQLEATQLHLTLRAVPGEPDRTELTMTCDLRPGVQRNVRASRWIAGTVGGVTGSCTAAALAKGAWALVASAAVAGPAVGVAAGVAGLSLVWYRRLYPSAVRRAQAEMRSALEAIGAALQAEAVFGTSDEAPTPPRRLGPAAPPHV
ncbi:MAG TPA: protein kinase [Gemmatirosa sp.]|nr:protein kinase [Gemmatirosa sp.]